MKPKAEGWLTKAFADGVDQQHPRWEGGPPVIMHPKEACWLARHDRAHHYCTGRLERFHFIPRQRVENAMWEALPDGWDLAGQGEDMGGSADYFMSEAVYRKWRDDLILLAAWDPRNGGIGCSGHHKRFDNHLGPKLKVDGYDLPWHVKEFASDWGLESLLVERFNAVEIIGPIDDPMVVF